MNGPRESAISTLATPCDASVQTAHDYETPCFSLSPDESSRSVTAKHAECTDAPIASTTPTAKGAECSDRPAGDVRQEVQDPVTSAEHDVEHPPESTRNLERAIVAATLAGRHSTADLLADRLRERLARDRGNVVRLDDRDRERKR